MIPHYWNEALTFLSENDPVMATLIERYPEASFKNRGDSLQTLLRAVVGQQISVKAADSIWSRLESLCSEVSCENLKKLDHETLRSAGLSLRKAQYITNIVDHFDTRKIDDNYWKERDYEAIYQELIEIKGVGRWTIEMFAIFYLHEPDIFSSGDIGIRKAIQQLYFDNAPQPLETLEALSENWRPYRTIALWFLWRHLDPIPITY